MVSSQQQDSILGLCDNSSTAGFKAETKQRRWWISPVKNNDGPGLTPFTSYLATWRRISFYDSVSAAREGGVSAVFPWKWN